MIDRALITGASGFIGGVLAARLRCPSSSLSLRGADWLAAAKAARYEGAVVFHLAARVPDGARTPAHVFLQDNAEKTRVLAEHAARGGARRVVFLSSAKVNGDETGDRAFTPGDPPRPADAYASSKLAAESALQEIARSSPLELCIVRSPLVYGAGAKGNLRALARLADSAWPLPFAAIENRRSFIHVDDLVSLLLACATDDWARGRILFGAHSDAASTPRLVATLRAKLGRPARMFHVAPRALDMGAAAMGQGARMRSLTRSLEVDASETRAALGWDAKVGFEAAVADLLHQERRR